MRSTAAVRFGALRSLELAVPIATSALSPKTTPGGASGKLSLRGFAFGKLGKRQAAKGTQQVRKGFQVEERRSVSRGAELLTAVTKIFF